MKRSLFICILISMISCVNAQNEIIRLEKPNFQRGESIMQALSKRQSIKIFSSKELKMQDLSDLLWAANGINRPESGKRTAPSALNKQDIKVYACFAEGSYLYNHREHVLELISKGDVRPVKAPVCLILVSDENNTYGAIDAGIVSQNISLFCAGVGLATYPRASMDTGELERALKLDADQTLILCNPVGYFK